MSKKTAILIIPGSSSPTGLTAGSTLVGSGEMGRVEMELISAKHQTQFADQPFVLEVKLKERTWFDDAHPITSITYDNYRNKAEVTTCTFTS